MSEPMVAIHGKVVPASAGDAASLVSAHAELLQDRIGVRLAAESLSVALQEPWNFPSEPVRVDLPGSDTTLSLVPCEVDRIKGYIVRSDGIEAQAPDHLIRVIEIVTPVNVREVLALEDGDDVEVVLRERDAESVVAERRLLYSGIIGIAIVVLGALLGLITAVSSFGLAVIVVVCFGAVFVIGALWVRFFRQARTLP